MNVTLKSSNDDIRNLHAAGDVLMESGRKAGQNVYLNGDLTMQNLIKIPIRYSGECICRWNIYGNNTQINGNSRAGGSTNQHNPGNVNVIIQPENKPNPQKPTFPIVEKVLPPELSVFSPTQVKILLFLKEALISLLNRGFMVIVVNGGTVVFKSGDYVLIK